MLEFLLTSLCLSLSASPWQIDHPREGITVLRDESGAWGGFSMGVAHQNKPSYQTRKILDLTALPAEARLSAKEARLRLFFAIQDYSWNAGAHNGLNEAFEIVINRTPLMFETSDPRFPSRAGREDPLVADWVDIDLPLDFLDANSVEVLIRKTPGGENDDYIYPGIDNTVSHGHSATSFDGGKTWHQDKLNAIDAQGEFIVRLVLIDRDLTGTAIWRLPDDVEDPLGWIAYRCRDGNELRIEPNMSAFDRSRPVTAKVSFNGEAPRVVWRTLEGSELEAEKLLQEESLLSTVSPRWNALDACVISWPEETNLSEVAFEFTQLTREPDPVVDLCPVVAPPSKIERKKAPFCRTHGDEVLLGCGCLEATFQVAPKLSLLSLTVAKLGRNVLVDPEATDLFRIKVDDRVYGCRDCVVEKVRVEEDALAASLVLPEARLGILFQATARTDEIALDLDVSNQGNESVQFHAAFPHLAGLVLSEDPTDDHYLFPWGGGVIANVNTHLRTAYGENSCWWQMVDLFSATGGGGLYLRADDPTGLYKSACLRKGETVRGDYSIDEAGRGYIDQDMLWRNALSPAPGFGITFDYLQRTRGPGESFTLPTGCLGSHPGTWKEAMRIYADWSHKTWPPRPYPSKLTSCWHVVAPGWGQTPLFKDGKYRTDYLVPENDVAEMMSWWTWSELGPWGVPMDRLKEELGEALYNRYKSYWVKEPVTGKLMYPLNRGDYDGYMPQWGGLQALRAHIEKVRDAGILPMFYTDPLLACANSDMGRLHGRQYGIMNPRWKDGYNTGKTPEGYVGSYASYNMCQDTEWYASWLAETIARVCRETGIDGVRLDEYGHRGYVCHSDKHEHRFAEPGHNAWLQALAHNVKQVHEAMDEVRPGLVLTTEFPGHDHMASSLEGAIVYDVRRIRPIRPVPINLFRFYFPHCKVFEIDRPPRPEARDWMLWNGVGAFSALYSEPVHALLKEYTDVIEGPDNEPLIPTLIPRVYANRFGKGKRQLITVHNATGHTVDGPVLEVRPVPGFRYFDPLTGKEIVPIPHEPGHALCLKLARDETKTVARLPLARP